MAINSGNTISIEYTLRLDDGTEVDSNVGGEPLTFEAGARQIIPGLEKELVEMAEGEARDVTVPAAEGYGEVDPQAFQTVETSQIPEGARHVGAQLVAKASGGQQIPVRIHEVSDESTILDMNHPLAGQNLNFSVKILKVA